MCKIEAENFCLINENLNLHKRNYVATGISARCRPDAMNEKFRKDDTRLHGMCYGAI